MLDCIVNDELVLRGMGAAHQLYKTSGKPPQYLLQLINEGPGAHIRTHAYRYRAQIDREMSECTFQPKVTKSGEHATSRVRGGGVVARMDAWQKKRDRKLQNERAKKGQTRLSAGAFTPTAAAVHM